MLHKVGREVIYYDGAFKTPSGPKRSRLWNPVPEQLLDALELSRKLVLEQSGGDWIVVITRHLERFQTDNLMAKLIMYVPAGADQDNQTLRALESFEDILAERLGAPVDTTYRSVEEGQPSCVICGQHATKVREEVRNDGLSDPTYFCEQHEYRLSDREFSGGNPIYTWQRL